MLNFKNAINLLVQCCSQKEFWVLGVPDNFDKGANVHNE